MTFLLLDVFLGYQTISSRNRDVEIVPQGELIPSGFEELLQTRQITLEAEVPKETPEMHYINVRFTNFSNQLDKFAGQAVEQRGMGIIVQLTEPVAASENRGDLVKNIERYVAFAQQYAFDEQRSTAGIGRYVQIYQQYPLFSAPLDIVTSEKKIRGYHQIHVQVINQGIGRKVISALTAVRTLLDNGYIRYGEKISGISIGYYGHMYDADIQVLAPVWRVIHTGSIHYVNGITGAIEQAVPLDKNKNFTNNK